MSKAASLAESLLKEHGSKLSQVTLIPSSGGVFEVTFGDSLIYSKKETGKFPEPDEVVNAVGAG